MESVSSLTDILKQDKKFTSSFKEQTWTGTFNEYLNIVQNNPKTVRNSYQRLYDMIMSHGTETFTYCKRKYTRYNFFSEVGDISIFGLEEPLMQFVDVLRSAAYHYGPERRILLLHGPVGSSKSTIVTSIKKGLEQYSATDDGALYSFSWRIENEDGEEKIIPCPMNEEPLKLLPDRIRDKILNELNTKLESTGGYRVSLDGNLSPVSEYYQKELLRKYDGDYLKVLDHIIVRRVVISEKNRVGIGTFQPKDERESKCYDCRC